jgi:membrane-associated protein
MTLETLIQSVGYFGVGAIVFAESGLLIGFFLPGDSLLFTAGFLASQGFFDIAVMAGVCWIAAVTGDSVGYAFGHRWGRRLFDRPDSRFFKKENLHRAERFYAKHGGKTIIIARFVPVVRTFAPIVAGMGEMSYRKFLSYNIIGGTIWGLGMPFLGYWLGGTVPGIDRYLLPVLAIIIFLSVLPGILEMVKTPERRRSLRTMVGRIFSRRQ